MPFEGVSDRGDGGVDAAFNGIVKRYYERILKFCLYALGGNLTLAEDCAQDIFLILYEKMGELRDYDRIGGWLYKTAGNVSKRYAAAARKECAKTAAPFVNDAEGGREAVLDRIAARTAGSEEERIAEEEAVEQAACTILERLKPGDERVLELAFRQRQPLKEVAARLGISLSAVKSRTSRLRQKITALAHQLLAD